MVGFTISVSSNCRPPTHRLATIHERNQPTTNQPTTSRHCLSQYAPLTAVNEEPTDNRTRFENVKTAGIT